MNVWVKRSERIDPWLIDSLANQVDREEISASSGNSIKDILRWAIDNSDITLTAWCPEGPLCMFGITMTSAMIKTGTPWLISTEFVQRYQFPFIRNSIPYFEAMRQDYDRLVNYVDERHVIAQRWLRWLGFSMGPPRPYGVKQLPFRRFWWNKETVVQCVM